MTLAPGDRLSSTRFETYVRILKDRLDGSNSRYVARCVFNTKHNAYEEGFTLGTLSSDLKEFEPIGDEDLPFWARKDFHETT